MPQAADTAVRQDGPPAPKRAKQTGPPRVRGKKGALKTFTTLPLDLIVEICGHLHVRDLYTLSNVSKVFRQIMLADLGKNLFALARERIGMPTLSLSVGSDLRYAAWFYGKGCNICHKKTGGKPDVNFRARICKKCREHEFLHTLAHRRHDTFRELNSFTAFFATTTQVERERGYYRYYLPELHKISDDIDDRFPYTRQCGLAWLHRDQLPGDSDLSSEDYDRLKKDWTYVRSVSIIDSPEYENPPEPDGELQRLFLARHNENKLRCKDTLALSQWLGEAEEDSRQSRKQKRLARLDEIKRRLQAVGFHESEFNAPQFWRHRLVRSTRPISDLSYPTKVEPVLRKVLQDRRRDRIREVLEVNYQHVRNSHVDGDTFPPTSVYVELESFSPLFDDCVSRNPPANPIIPASFKAHALKAILEIVRERREGAARMIASAYLELVKDEDTRKENEVEDEDDNEDDNDLPDRWIETSIAKLPLTLPPLPEWVPTSAEAPIVASDLQLREFVFGQDFGYLACTRCGQLNHPDDFLSDDRHDRDCFRSEISGHNWFTVESASGPPGSAMFRIGKDMLGLVLKVRQLIETEWETRDAVEGVSNLASVYEIEPPEKEEMDMMVACSCGFHTHRFGPYNSDFSVLAVYQHLVDAHDAIVEDPCNRQDVKISAKLSLKSEYMRKYTLKYTLKLLQLVGHKTKDRLRYDFAERSTGFGHVAEVYEP